jgi:thiol:disulfide interchange protein DsbD
MLDVAVAGVLFVVSLTAASPPAVVTVGPDAPVAAYQGIQIEIPIAIKVAPGLHVQANPASRPELIPLSIKIDDARGLKVGRPLYPAGRAYRIEGSEDAISVYEGSFDVGLPVDVPSDASMGNRVLKGSIRFQACDDRRCYPPTVIAFAQTVVVEAHDKTKSPSAVPPAQCVRDQPTGRR